MLSIIDYANGKYGSAIQMIDKSIALGASSYTLSAAALLNMNVLKDTDRAFILANEAVQMNSEDLSIACLFAEVCASAERYSEFLEYYKNASPKLREEGRLKMFVGKFLVNLNKIEEAEKYINKELSIPDIREGEYSVTNIWIEMYRKKMALDMGVNADSISDEEVNLKYPIPYEIDFRMH
jgi:tetratricopeptide (TPR) repeat protein